MQYSEKKIMRILKGEADVPKEVTARIDQTIRQIKENSGDRNMRKRGFRCHAAAAVAVIILFGTVTAGAAGFFLWNQDVAVWRRRSAAEGIGTKEGDRSGGGRCGGSGSHDFPGTVSGDGKVYVSVF